MGEVLRFERLRRRWWRWYVWAIYPDGFAFPITRSGFWTRFGADRFIVDIDWHRRIQGGVWRFEVRRSGG